MDRALIFDLNGTMIDDMYYHAKAWNELLINDLKVGIEWDTIIENMYGKNSEVLNRLFGVDFFTINEMKMISENKERLYQQLYKPLVKPIEGLVPFLAEAQKNGIKMGIGSAAIPENIDFVIDALDVRKYFKSIVSAAHVVNSKPDPETFLLNAVQLGVTPSSCIVIEDSPKGVEAALTAGMSCIVITTMHDESVFETYPNILRFITDYTGITIDSLI